MDDLAGDWLAPHGKCRVCGLDLPRAGADDGICSRACAGRRGESRAVLADEAALAEAILSELRTLAKDSTLCPGELSVRIRPGVAKPIGVLRPVIFRLAQAGTLRTLQKGHVVPWTKIRGPFRVRL